MIPKSVAWVFLSSLFSRGLAALAGILLLRELPAESFALFTFGTSVALLMTHTISVPMAHVLIVEDSRKKALSGMSALSLIVFQLLFCFVAAVLVMPLFTDWVQGYFVVVGLAVSLVLFEYLRVQYQKQQRFAVYGMLDTLRTGCTLAAVVIVIYSAFFLQKDIWVLLMQAGITLLLALFFMKSWLFEKQSRFKWREVRQTNRLVITQYKFLFLYFAGTTIFSQLDVLMLKELVAPEILAEYGVALRVYHLFVLLLAAVQAVLLPKVQNAGEDELVHLLKRYKVGLVWLAPVYVLGIVAAPWFMPIIDEGRYPAAIPVFQILAVLSFLLIMWAPYVQLMIRQALYRQLCVIILTGTLMNLALNFWLIPVYGSLGAAITTLISASYVSGSLWFTCKRRKSLTSSP